MTTGTTETTATTNYSPMCFMCLEPKAFLTKAFTQETRSVLKSTVRVAIKNTALL